MHLASPALHVHKQQLNEHSRYLPSQMSTRNAIDANATFQNNWIKLLRTRRGSSAPLLKCPYCHDPPTFTEENDLWHHVKKTHAVHIPRDESRVKRFRDEVLARSRALSKKEATSPEPPRLPTDGQLTASKLEDLQKAELASSNAAKRQPVMSNTFLADEQDYKKQAIGLGKCPSSSHSQGSNPPRSQALPASRRAASSPTQGKARDSMEFLSRGPTTSGKRLFNPSEPSSPQAQNVSSPGGSAQARPAHQIRKRLSNPQHVAATATEKPAPSFARGTLPGDILMSGNPQGPQGAQLSSPTFDHTRMVSQPETRPISQEQLVAEVKGIYVGLVMVEGKCIQVDLKQAQLAKEAPRGTQPKLNNEQYQALIALHRTLLHEHHDFFLASQHPSATPAVRRLPLKYAMPARLWRHAIHSFLELLRNRLPASLDYMLAFIYLAYSMMTLLLETVPAFEDTWIECLGDLGRYRMAIEDDNVRDREVWAQVARQWYLKSANRSPITGRLYHHLAILARPDALPQLLYYGKSLAVPIPFTAARESIMTLFEPTLNPVAGKPRFSAVITAIVRSHATIFTGKSLDTFEETLGEIKGNLDGHIGRITKKYLEQGYYIAISNCIALLGYGADDNPLALLLKPQPTSANTLMTDANADSTPTPALSATFTASLRLFTQVAKIHLDRIGDINTLSFLHVTLVFIRHLSRHPAAASLIYPHFPWTNLVRALNALTVLYPPTRAAIESPTIPIPDSGPSPARQETTPHTPPPPTAPLDPSQLDIAGAHDAVAPAKDIFRPFPEEFAMQGLGFTAGYFPENWFANENVEPETHYLEAESMRSQHRPERVLWLGVQIARLAPEWMGYSSVDGYTFSVGEKAKEYVGGDEEGESGSGSGSEYGDEIDSDQGSKARSESETLTMDVDDRLVSEQGDEGSLSFLDMRDAGNTSGGLEAGDAVGDVG
ncbi:hypothetical protein VC83_04915 [Pseudogymnoascus destructans]|uniref:Nonsense-mediated mRNA decay factor n=2 Tax=Pseudogymnoascus destructans TaxID=655981 RepID=L8G2Y4_PSED2|nr:uncharacterized protein VC83_04915 [Pseudogymnoascus destructans]ELR07169.1 hypothetical protein GMDG_08296 [Pseudogymnoascus destructans 20631-21]OAF58678.1 hypothetical protein VC83_04915 [Pseudogymnoascus destructans]